jgi:hypothetical protein
MDHEPNTDETNAHESASFRTGLVLTLVAAVAIFVFGGALQNIAPRPASAPDSGRPIPEALEPTGDLTNPPTVFRWRPSGPEASATQFLLYRGNLDRLWASGPLRDSVVTVPVEAYLGVPAGEPCFWRVREVANGRALATSALTQFQFEVDSQGYRAEEAPEIFDYIQN